MNSYGLSLLLPTGTDVVVRARGIRIAPLPASRLCTVTLNMRSSCIFCRVILRSCVHCVPGHIGIGTNPSHARWFRRKFRCACRQPESRPSNSSRLQLALVSVETDLLIAHKRSGRRHGALTAPKAGRLRCRVVSDEGTRTPGKRGRLIKDDGLQVSLYCMPSRVA